MERLTERNPLWIDDELWERACEPDCEEIDAVYRKLKDYEDTEEQGLLLRLPCGIGSDVYLIPSKVNYELNILSLHPENNKIYHQKVAFITFTEKDSTWSVTKIGNMVQTESCQKKCTRKPGFYHKMKPKPSWQKWRKRMEDRYLCKAKRTDNGEWVIGGLVRYGFTGREKYYIVPSYASDLYALKIDPSTICWCTGLKDKNGKLIWENDVCDRKEEYPEIVKYNKGDWTLDYSYSKIEKADIATVI